MKCPARRKQTLSLPILRCSGSPSPGRQASTAFSGSCSWIPALAVISHLRFAYLEKCPFLLRYLLTYLWASTLLGQLSAALPPARGSYPGYTCLLVTGPLGEQLWTDTSQQKARSCVWLPVTPARKHEPPQPEYTDVHPFPWEWRSPRWLASRHRWLFLSLRYLSDILPSSF